MKHTDIRKIRHRGHKCFGRTSRMVDGKYVMPEEAGGRSIGSKQILPGAYGRRRGGYSDSRSPAEKLNATLRREQGEA